MFLSLSDTGVRQVATVTDDLGGGATFVWAAAGTVACRLDPVNLAPSGRVTGGRVDERSTHVVTVPAGFAVTADDRFVVEGRGTFEVTATRDRTSSPASSFEVLKLS